LEKDQAKGKIEKQYKNIEVLDGYTEYYS